MTGVRHRPDDRATRPKHRQRLPAKIWQALHASGVRRKTIADEQVLSVEILPRRTLVTRGEYKRRGVRMLEEPRGKHRWFV